MNWTIKECIFSNLRQNLQSSNLCRIVMLTMFDVSFWVGHFVNVCGPIVMKWNVVLEVCCQEAPSLLPWVNFSAVSFFFLLHLFLSVFFLLFFYIESIFGPDVVVVLFSMHSEMAIFLNLLRKQTEVDRKRLKFCFSFSNRRIEPFASVFLFLGLRWSCCNALFFLVYYSRVQG